MLNQRYLIEREITAGSDSRVYKARDSLQNYSVLIKAYLPSAMQNWKRFQLIEREARILAQLNHIEIPNFVDFFTQGEEGQQTLYLVSKWIHGETLAEKMSLGWRASLNEVFDLAEMALKLLMYIHAFNPPIVHRDIKPSNFILSTYGRLFLLDFGGVQEVMAAQGAGGSTLVGTMGFMPPEQLMGRAIPATDLYALGMTLLLCLTGLTPEELLTADARIDFERIESILTTENQLNSKTKIWFEALLAQNLVSRYDSAENALTDLDIVRGFKAVQRTIYLPEHHKVHIPEIIHSLTLIERSEQDTRLLEGSLLEGRYEVGGLLGSGTHSRVYTGTLIQTGMAVIIKELALESVDTWKNIELFEREIEVMSRLKHARIPAFLEAFQVREGNTQSWYLITEAIQAETLDHKLSSGWRPDDDTIWSIGAQLLDILVYLHQQNPSLIHRDIKPSNILITPDHQVYLIDFGAVQNRLWASGGGGSTIIGTFGYMAPELFSGQACPATDLYALGASLVNLLSGKHPIEIPLDARGLNFEPFVRCDDFYQIWLKALLHPDLKQRLGSAQVALDLLQDAKSGGQKSEAWYLEHRKKGSETAALKSAGGLKIVPENIHLNSIQQYLSNTEMVLKEPDPYTHVNNSLLQASKQFEVIFPADARLAQTCQNLFKYKIDRVIMYGLICSFPFLFLFPAFMIPFLLVTTIGAILWIFMRRLRNKSLQLPLKFRDYNPWYQSSKYPESHPLILLNASLFMTEEGFAFSYRNKLSSLTSRFSLLWSQLKDVRFQAYQPEFEFWDLYTLRPIQHLQFELKEPIWIHSGGDGSFMLRTYDVYVSLSDSDAKRMIEIIKGLRMAYTLAKEPDTR